MTFGGREENRLPETKCYLVSDHYIKENLWIFSSAYHGFLMLGNVIRMLRSSST